MPKLDPTVAPSTRQEAFCRHFVASGNAADAARQAGYAERDDGDPRDDDRIDDDRADGAEHDWFYQRRDGYAELYDPWTPENVEFRRQDRFEREVMRCGEDPFDTGEPGDTDWPDDAEFAPDHDIS